MAFRFKPIDRTFFDLLSASAAKLVEGSVLLGQVFGEGADRGALASQMSELERACDDTTHAIIRRVNGAFVTPLDREDIYALASALDDVMDNMEKAVDLIVLYAVGELPDQFADLADVVGRCAEITAEAMPRLRSLRDLQGYWVEINRLENAGDQSYRAIMADLFGGSHAALDVMKFKDIAAALEQAINSFETVAKIVEQIYVKES